MKVLVDLMELSIKVASERQRLIDIIDILEEDSETYAIDLNKIEEYNSGMQFVLDLIKEMSKDAK